MTHSLHLAGSDSDLTGLYFILLQIVKDVGLCITLWDVLEKGDELFFPQEGAAFLKGKPRALTDSFSTRVYVHTCRWKPPRVFPVDCHSRVLEFMEIISLGLL